MKYAELKLSLLNLLDQQTRKAFVSCLTLENPSVKLERNDAFSIFYFLETRGFMTVKDVSRVISAIENNLNFDKNTNKRLNEIRNLFQTYQDKQQCSTMHELDAYEIMKNEIDNFISENNRSILTNMVVQGANPKLTSYLNEDNKHLIEYLEDKDYISAKSVVSLLKITSSYPELAKVHKILTQYQDSIL